MKKFKGSALIGSVIAILVLVLLMSSVAYMCGGILSAFSAFDNVNYADRVLNKEAEKLKNMEFKKLDSEGAHVKRDCGFDGYDEWKTEVTLSEEKQMGDDGENKFRVAEIKAYYQDETEPRATTQIPLSVRNETNGGGVSVGTIIFYPMDELPSFAQKNKYLECNGQAFDKEKYPALALVYPDGIVPNLEGRFLEGSDSPNCLVDAGLPNIGGRCERFTQIRWADAEGAIFYYSHYYSTTNFTSYNNPGTIWDMNNMVDIHFDASRCNELYGKSDTVQPASYTGKFYVKAK